MDPQPRRAGRRGWCVDSWLLASPILPGKLEEWRRFCQALQGSRRAEYAQSRRRLGIAREQTWLAQTAHGGIAIVYLEAAHPAQVIPRLAASELPVDRWLRQQYLELHGQDLAAHLSLPAQER